ncbi:MAG: hypothetical protein KF871_11220 [Hydrogenophaga sp.]|uniref:hypothetical protein n=1 Tax=Hydrogenophaga sp. TaxID=1904254 RepID=UPI001DCE827F|nr:hypothetical protein [Hydrogenophaga sp.]MBX3610454.1 hypothetical protein [Hydrogenophaga sp.]
MPQAQPRPTTAADEPQPRDDALTTACATRRLQPYRLAHKALRATLSQVLHNAGALDAADPQERARLVDDVERLLAVCADHLAHENRYLHEPLRERSAHAVLAFHYDHLDHLDAIDNMRLLLQRLRDAGAHGDDVEALGYELYLRLSQFVGDSLAHMSEEEGTLTCALWAHFSDDELQALIDRLRDALSPAEMEGFVRTLAGALNTSELAHLIDDMQHSLPPARARGLLGLLRDELHALRRTDVAARLGLPPEPLLFAT